MKYTITGATGHLGRKVVEQLSRLVDIQDIRLAVHTPSKAQAFWDQGYEVVKSDYYDVQSMTKAFTDTDVLIYIPSITYDVANRVLEFENSLKSMQKAGVKIWSMSVLLPISPIILSRWQDIMPTCPLASPVPN